MAKNHPLKLSAINTYFTNNKRLLDRGENSFESGHVVKLDFDSAAMTIRGSVLASMKNKTYNVKVFLTDEFLIEKAECECPRGIEICHHIAATLYAAHSELSKTDVSCSWVPKARDVSEVKTCRELCKIKKPPRVTQNDLSQNDIDELRKKLQLVPPMGITWLLKEEPSEDDNAITLVADIKSTLLSEDYDTDDRTSFMKNALKLSSVQIASIAEKTVERYKCVEWLDVRKLRITAGAFGLLIGCIGRNRYPPSLFKKLLDQRNLGCFKAVQWNRDNLDLAVKALEEHLREPIKRTGVWLSHSGVLCASPVGFYGDYVVDIKCYYKGRKYTLKEALSVDLDYAIRYDTNSKHWVVNQSHDYYHSIQGKIHLANKRAGYLVIWTPLEVVIEKIAKDSEWADNMTKMEQFYFDSFIPYLLQNEDLNSTTFLNKT